MTPHRQSGDLGRGRLCGHQGPCPARWHRSGQPQRRRWRRGRRRRYPWPQSGRRRRPIGAQKAAGPRRLWRPGPGAAHLRWGRCAPPEWPRGGAAPAAIRPCWSPGTIRARAVHLPGRSASGQAAHVPRRQGAWARAVWGWSRRIAPPRRRPTAQWPQQLPRATARLRGAPGRRAPRRPRAPERPVRDGRRRPTGRQESRLHRSRQPLASEPLRKAQVRLPCCPPSPGPATHARRGQAVLPSPQKGGAVVRPAS
mmetsp:Transcript_15631/g.51038  ORF Transcript_15631/g.51038 Transcript_15631/m.51038 type:complete len:254 (-) Transcript_15631:283-1044(-)